MGSAGFIPNFGTAAQKLTQRLDLYVAADAANASDSNPGTAAQPLLTFDEAIDRVNAYDEIGEGDANNIAVVIHMAPAVAPYTWSVHFEPSLLRGNIAVYGDGAAQGGDGFTQLLASTAAVAGSSISQIVTGGGLGANTYRSRYIQVLTGAAAGDMRQIRDHTDTTIIPVRNFSAAIAATDTFRIVQPAVVINRAATLLLGHGLNGGINTSVWFGNLGALPELAFVNLSLTQTAGVGAGRFANSRVAFYGCLHDANAGAYTCDGSTVMHGCDYVGSSCNANLGVGLGAVGVLSWSGWGSAFAGAYQAVSGAHGGFFCVATNVSTRGDLFQMVGGSVFGSAAGGVIQIGIAAASRIVIGSIGGTSVAPLVALSNGTAGAAVLDLSNPTSGFSIGSVVELISCTLTPNAGPLLRTRGIDVFVGTAANVSGAGTIGIDCRGTAVVRLNGVTGLLGAAGNDLTCDAGATFVAAGALGAADAAQLNVATGSTIIRVN